MHAAFDEAEAFFYYYYLGGYFLLQ